MKYNPEIHHRRSIRLKGYDYSREGMYFITICCDKKTHRFGYVENGEMILNDYGKIAYVEWLKLAERFENFELDVFQIMPNHMHGIISLRSVGTGLASAQIAPVAEVARDLAGAGNLDIGADIGAGASPARTTVSDVVGAYKSLVANACLDLFKSKFIAAGFAPEQIPIFGKLWQRNFYEHIIRNERAYHNISNYIINNPAKWQADKFF